MNGHSTSNFQLPRMGLTDRAKYASSSCDLPSFLNGIYPLNPVQVLLNTFPPGLLVVADAEPAAESSCTEFAHRNPES